MNDIFVTRPSLPDFDEYVQEIRTIWDTKHITNFGDKYLALIDLIKDRFGYEYVDLQCNGHMTLQNILSCLEPGEIITTSFSFVSTSLAILNSGHRPVFCDISMDDYNIDVSRIEELITEKTVAIVPVHVFGVPCDVEAIENIAQKHGLKVVYDAAHAFGVRIGTREIGSFGNASMFSFHATKVFNTIEGGMAVFDDPDWKNQCISRSNFGISDGLTVYDGVNSKMNEFQASMGIVNIRHLDENLEKRRKITEKYDEAFSDITGIRTSAHDADIHYNYAYYPILIDCDDPEVTERFVEWCNDRDIYPRRYFYPAINDMPLFSASANETPAAKYVSDRIVCLPIFADMSESESQRVVDSVRGFFG